ncbi:DUF2735 domain-containing protein [Geminicoccus roseus]|uniref:DUF2735 domain-containing protein n=1 Tax=Geminicoccus roseus TaxID=404900 RepID=UPI000412A684|nr:DUF2735 domain-containing protein [Geminicoccus roseus]
MTRSLHQDSAKIYQFPVRAKPAGASFRGPSLPVTDIRTTQYVHVDCGAGWYHEAAVQDAERAARRRNAGRGD